MKTTTVCDFAPETLSLLNALLSAGFSLVSGNNGDDDFSPTDFPTLAAFVEELTAADEARLRVRFPMGSARTGSLYLVLGNSPGELVCDYTAAPELDAVCEAQADLWNGKDQPMRAL